MSIFGVEYDDETGRSLSMFHGGVFTKLYCDSKLGDYICQQITINDSLSEKEEIGALYVECIWGGSNFLHECHG